MSISRDPKRDHKNRDMRNPMADNEFGPELETPKSRDMRRFNAAKGLTQLTLLCGLNGMCARSSLHAPRSTLRGTSAKHMRADPVECLTAPAPRTPPGCAPHSVLARAVEGIAAIDEDRIRVSRGLRTNRLEAPCDDPCPFTAGAPGSRPAGRTRWRR